ncbi:SDR family NAD(P)-dependent oxidoreductase [Seonamhaeicola sp.]|uniref:SDR family NAD(P)-dependent oxidoreductase n=1 Tax=Seonamhaeicola sp. TaxID=1912245 RepID=UPI003561758E
MNKPSNLYLEELLIDSNLFTDVLGKKTSKIVQHDFSKETILITGAAGSIGSELSKQLIKSKFKKLILIDVAESPLYNLIKEVEFENTENVEFILLNILEKEAITNVFKKHKPTIILHTAAYKHVPLMENNPYEAVKLNIFGTKLLADISNSFKVKKFIFISTDKAVNPVSIMGISKKVAENYINQLSKKSDTLFCSTRFGNIFGSNGSVLLLFKRQIELGLPITVTHKEISRFFISKHKACKLILDVANFDYTDYHVFTFNMGKPIKIIDLANRLKVLYASKNVKIDVVITSLRPGEKLNEEIISENEALLPTKNKEIFLVKNDYFTASSSLDFSKLETITPYFSKDKIKSILLSFI